MTIAITDDHRSLAQTASELLQKRDARGAARALLEARRRDASRLLVGHGGARLARSAPARGARRLRVRPARAGRGDRGAGTCHHPRAVRPDGDRERRASRRFPARRRTASSPASPTAQSVGAVTLAGDVTVQDGKASGAVGPVIGGGLADIVLVAVGDDVAVVDLRGPGVTLEQPLNLDPTRHAARVTLDGANAELLPARAAGARRPHPHALRGRGDGHGARVHRARGRVREGAPAVRPSDRDVPGREAPLRQHARGDRARHGGGLGRGPCRGDRRRPARSHLRRSPPRSRSPPPTSAPT